jgi:hypothetical protein
VNPEVRSCETVLRFLDAYVNSELLAETNLEILRHLEACVACTSALESRIRLRATLKQTVQSVPVPAGLPNAVRSALPQRHAARAGAGWAAAAAVALAVLLGVVGIRYLPQPDLPAQDDAREILSLGLDAHRHCSPRAGMDTLGWEYDGLVNVIGEEMPSNYGIAAAHRCFVGDRLFVHVVLEGETSRVSFLVTEKQGERLSESPRSRAAEAAGVPVYSSSGDRYQIAAFETSRHLAFVVSDLPATDNLRLASLIASLYAPSVRSTLKEAGDAH